MLEQMFVIVLRLYIWLEALIPENWNKEPFYACTPKGLWEAFCTSYEEDMRKEQEKIVAQEHKALMHAMTLSEMGYLPQWVIDTLKENGEWGEEEEFVDDEDHMNIRIFDLAEWMHWPRITLQEESQLESMAGSK
jgi:hypothetical protein